MLIDSDFIGNVEITANGKKQTNIGLKKNLKPNESTTFGQKSLDSTLNM